MLATEGDRKAKFEFFVQLMRGCLAARNYNTSYAILLGLKLRAVSRLEVMDLISEESRTIFNEISSLFSYQSAYKTYRGIAHFWCFFSFEQLSKFPRRERDDRGGAGHS